MPDLAQFFPVIVGLGVVCLIVTLAWRSILKEREQSREREERAVMRGWAYRSGSPQQGFSWALSGSEGGTVWTLEVSRSKGKNAAQRATLTAPELRCAAGAVWAGSSSLVKFFRSSIGRKLIGWGLQLTHAQTTSAGMAGPLLDEGALEVDLGDSDFAALYGVLATDSGSAFQLLNAEVRRAMLDWEEGHKTGNAKGFLGVTWGPEGVAVTWGGRAVASGDDMVAFVELGQRVMKAARGGW
jgi:hypothetical protein